ncbi:MAG: hypothetical protein ACRDPY_28620 [Streptosporangiaceae bacterium]
MQPRHRTSAGWEIARWWVYALVLTPFVLPFVLLAHGHINAAMVIWAFAIVVVIAVARGAKRGRPGS